MFSYQSQVSNEIIKAKTEATFFLSSTGFQIFFVVSRLTHDILDRNFYFQETLLRIAFPKGLGMSRYLTVFFSCRPQDTCMERKEIFSKGIL